MQVLQNKVSTLILFVVLSLIPFLAGCLPLLSMQPLYTEDTVVFDEQLLGKWYGDKEIWNFTKSGENKYNLEVVQETNKGTLEVHLVKLQGKFFLDLYPEKSDEIEKMPVVYQIGLIPTHIILYAELTDNQLDLRLVQFDELLKDDPNVIEHINMDDCPVITAEPQKIQQVLTDNLDNDNVIDDDQNIFYRAKPMYSLADIFFSDMLLGQWQSEDGITFDCIAWENGYDIMVFHDDLELNCKGYLVNIEQKFYWALFKDQPQDENAVGGLDLYPDYLLRIEPTETQLQTQQVDLYKTMESGSIQCEGNNIEVFQKL